MKRSKKKLAVLSAAMFLTVTGIYNSVVINAESTISGDEVRFVKRIDEIYGVVTPGRMVAASAKWHKLPSQQNALVAKPQMIQQTVSQVQAAPEIKTEEAPQATAAIQEELNLNLVEVVNPKKYANGINSAQFAGNLTTSNGTIDSLSVNLPNGEGLSVSFSEMSGNVFEYDCEQDVCSGMLYQVDQNSYMVTLTNGSLEGTRLRFIRPADISEPELVQSMSQENIDPGVFGQDQNNIQAQEYTQNEQQLQDPNQQQQQMQQPDPYAQEQFQQINQNDQAMQEQAQQAQLENPQQQPTF